MRATLGDATSRKAREKMCHRDHPAIFRQFCVSSFASGTLSFKNDFVLEDSFQILQIAIIPKGLFFSSIKISCFDYFSYGIILSSLMVHLLFSKISASVFHISCFSNSTLG